MPGWARARRRTIGPLCLLLAALFCAACEQEPRVPYIKPELHNWPTPYRGVNGLELHVFVTGHVRAPEALLRRGGSMTRTRTLPLPVFLLRHPRQGAVLFNTGPGTPRTGEKDGPATLLGGLLQPAVIPGDTVSAQMERAGLSADTVRWVVLTTMEAVHTGEVEKFPGARVVVARSEEAHARRAPAGYRLADFDDVLQWKFIDFEDAEPLGTFAAHVDLFGDGSCLLIDAPGSTPGTMVVLLRLPARPLLLADGLAPLPESVRYAARPVRAADFEDWWLGIWRLKRFKDLAPELLVVPGSDPSPLDGVARVVVHEAPTPAATPAPTVTPAPWERLIPKRM